MPAHELLGMKVCEKCGEPERDCCCKQPKLVNHADTEETPKEYLARIGAEGGKKSRRKLTKKDARRIANIRWRKNSTMKPQKKKSKREHYICNGRMLCLSHATTPPRQCSCGAQIFHIGTPEGAALKVKREAQKSRFSGGFLARPKKQRVLNRNIGESPDAVAWEGGR